MRLLRIEKRRSSKNGQYFASLICADNGEPLFRMTETVVKRDHRDEMIDQLINAIHDGRFEVVDRDHEKPKGEAGE